MDPRAYATPQTAQPQPETITVNHAAFRRAENHLLDFRDCERSDAPGRERVMAALHALREALNT